MDRKYDLVGKSIQPLPESAVEWKIVVSNYHSYSVQQMACYAKRATNISKALNRIAADKAKKAFEELVNRSLEENDKWLHKFCSNEYRHFPPNTYVDDGQGMRTRDQERGCKSQRRGPRKT